MILVTLILMTQPIGKRSCAKYHISQSVSSKQISMQHQNFIKTDDFLRISTSCKKWNMGGCWKAKRQENEWLQLDLHGQAQIDDNVESWLIQDCESGNK